MHLLPTLLAFCATFAITTLCIAWTPFAAIICARIARQKELIIKRPAVHGAIYSAMLFFPWQHLTRQMRGDPITRANIKDAHRVAYVTAGIVLASHFIFILTELLSPWSLSLEDWLEFTTAALIGALAFAAGLISLSRAKNRLNQLQERRESPNAIALPNKSYIAPFAWAWASMLISSAPWYYRMLGNLIWDWFIDR